MRIFADSSWRSICPGFRAPLFSMAILVSLISGSVADEVPLGNTFLTSANWSASVFSQHAGGSVCWIIGDDGSVRVEVLRDPEATREEFDQALGAVAATLESLMTWNGDGWTLVLGPDGSGTLNAWGKEWEQVPADLSRMVRLVTALVHYYPSFPPDFSFARFLGHSMGNAGIPRPGMLGPDANTGGDPDVRRYQLMSSDAPGFRKKMTTRGRGAGGVGEILVFHWWRPEGREGSALRVGSSRRPGSLQLDPPSQIAVKTPDPEVFLPLWPLSQFFDAR